MGKDGGQEDPTDAEGARLLFAQGHGTGSAQALSQSVRLGRLRRAVRHCVQHEPLLLATLAGVAVGVVLGTALSFAKLSPLALEIIGLPGDLLMRTLKMLVLPLITASVMAGVCALRQSTADMGKVARYTLLYYFSTTMGAVVLGIVIVNVVRPGRGSPFDQLDPASSGAGSCHAANQQKVASHTTAAGAHNSPVEAFLGVIKSAFPDNVFQAAASMNVLGIITVSLLMGAALSSMGPEAEPVVALINIFNDAIGKIVNWVIWTSPVGIASLITTSICRACNLAATLVALGLFIAAVLLGLLLWGFIVLPLTYYATTRRNPGQVYRGFAQAMATAFGTDSSNATLPITMRSAVALGCDPRIVQFFLPLGTTVNMNGTALYEAVTVIFIAQAHGVVLGAAGTVIVALTATLAAVGAAGIPSAGLVTMLMVLQAADLEQFASDIAIILAVDWFLDRCRTVVNVLGDSFGTVIIDHHARKWVSAASGAGLSGKDSDGGAAPGAGGVGDGAGGIELGAAVMHVPGPSSVPGGHAVAAATGEADADAESSSDVQVTTHHHLNNNYHHLHQRHHHGGDLFHHMYGTDFAEGVRQGLLAAASGPGGDPDGEAASVGDLSAARQYGQGAPLLSSTQPLVLGASSFADGNGHSLEHSRMLGAQATKLGPMGRVNGCELHHRHLHAAAAVPASVAPVPGPPPSGLAGAMTAGWQASASLECGGLVVATDGPANSHGRSGV